MSALFPPIIIDGPRPRLQKNLSMRLFTALPLILLSASLATAREKAEQKVVPGKPAARAGKQDEADKALDDAREFREKGEFAKALERHEWYHANALRINPAQYGVRLSFALSDWMRLGEKFPPAIASLKRIRDEGTKTLEEGKGNAALFHDVESINSKLSEEDASIALFKKLDANHPALAGKCFNMISETLMEKNEMDLFAKYVGDPKTYLAGHIETYVLTSDHIRKGPRGEAGVLRFKNRLIDLTLTLAKLATDKGDAALAAELKAMTHKVAPDPRVAP